MNDKSHVSLEQHVCLVCGKPFDTGAILLDKRLRASMERHTATGWGLCPEHQKLADEGFVALVECDPQRSGSQVSYGQSRVQVVWNRVILPDTSSLTLDNLVGTDPAGYAGLEDDVDWHWKRIFAGAALTTLLGVGAELAAPENRQDGNRIVIAGRDSAQDSINQVGQEMTRRNMNVQPTLTERPGLPVRIIVNRDLVLRPYQPLFFNRGASQ